MHSLVRMLGSKNKKHQCQKMGCSHQMQCWDRVQLHAVKSQLEQRALPCPILPGPPARSRVQRLHTTLWHFLSCLVTSISVVHIKQQSAFLCTSNFGLQSFLCSHLCDVPWYTSCSSSSSCWVPPPSQVASWLNTEDCSSDTLCFL